MNSLATALIIISMIVLFVSFLYYQSTVSQLDAMDIRLKDFFKRHMDYIQFEQYSRSKLETLDKKLKELKEMVESEQNSVDFCAQELIKLDREVAKIRPVNKFILQKVVKDETKKKNKTAH